MINKIETTTKLVRDKQEEKKTIKENVVFIIP